MKFRVIYNQVFPLYGKHSTHACFGSKHTDLGELSIEEIDNLKINIGEDEDIFVEYPTNEQLDELKKLKRFYIVKEEHYKCVELVYIREKASFKK